MTRPPHPSASSPPPTARRFCLAPKARSLVGQVSLVERRGPIMEVEMQGWVLLPVVGAPLRFEVAVVGRPDISARPASANPERGDVHADRVAAAGQLDGRVRRGRGRGGGRAWPTSPPPPIAAPASRACLSRARRRAAWSGPGEKEYVSPGPGRKRPKPRRTICARPGARAAGDGAARPPRARPRPAAVPADRASSPCGPGPQSGRPAARIRRRP